MHGTSIEVPIAQRRPRRRALRLCALCCAVLLLGVGACAGRVTDSATPTQGESALGRLGFGLIVRDGLMLSDVRYTITNADTDYLYEATAPISALKSDELALFLSLPAANEYRLDVEADVAGGGTCTGSSGFDIRTGHRTDVNVNLRCPRTDDLGTAAIEGLVNACPGVDSLVVLPEVAALEDGIALRAEASDVDKGPSELTYSWNSSLGVLGDSNMPTATLVCTEVGTATVQLTVSDGDSECNANVTFTVECVAPPPVAPPAPAP